MNIKLAADVTWNLLEHYVPPPNAPEACSHAHLTSMLGQITESIIVGDQAQRWLGWVQACLCMTGIASLDQLKAINKAA